MALATFGVSQIITVALGFLRLPFVIADVGTRNFGWVSLFVAASPWLGLVATATRSALRIVASEAPEASWDSSNWTATVRPAIIVGRSLLIAAAGSLAIAMIVFRDQQARYVCYALAISLAFAGSAGRGAARLGLWEAQGKVGRVNNLAALASVIGFVIAVVASGLNSPWPIYVFALLFPVFGPNWLIAVIPGARTSLASCHRDVRPGSARLVWKLSSLTGVQQLQNGVDPFIIGWGLGATAVAQYSLCSRVLTILLAGVAAIQPLVIRALAQKRSDGSSDQIRRAQIRFSILCVTSVAVPSGVIYLFRESIFGFISHERVEVPGMLLAVGIGQAALFAWQMPIFAALSGPAGTSLLARWMPVVAAVNLPLSVLMVSRGVWLPTAVSVVVAAVGHLVLFYFASRNRELYLGVHG